MEKMDVGEIREKIEGEGHADHHARNRWTAIYISVLAVCLAIVGLGGSNAMKEMINNNIAASDTWAFYQARNIRQTSLRLAADQLQLTLAARTDMPEDVRKDMTATIKRYKDTADRYESDPKSGDGKKELQKKAEEFGHERDLAQRKDPYFDFSQALFQISIVLASVFIVTGMSGLLYFSFGVSGLAALLMVNGFTLAFKLPLIG